MTALVLSCIVFSISGAEIKSKFNYLRSHFEVLGANLEYRERMIFEDIQIAIHKPKPNEQVHSDKIILHS